jgi:hypothetical protein
MYTGSISDYGPVNAAEAATFTRVYGRPVKLGEITDGTSNTLLASEVLPNFLSSSRDRLPPKKSAMNLKYR